MISIGDLEQVFGSLISDSASIIYWVAGWSAAAASNRPRLLLTSDGAVAQLGERLICIQEVAGSIPTSSTRLSPERTRVQAWRVETTGL